MLKHSRQDIKITGESCDGFIGSYITAVERIERMLVIHLVQKERAKVRVAGIKVDQKRFMLHVGKLYAEVCGHGCLALSCDRRGHIEALVPVSGAQPVAQDISRSGEVLHHERIADIVACHNGAFALVVCVVARNNADRLQAEERLHIAHIVERGVHQQLHHSKADARRKAQQGQQHDLVVAAAHHADQLRNRFIDDLQGAKLQGLGQNVACMTENAVPDSKSFFGIAPCEFHLQNLRTVILCDSDGASDLGDSITKQFILIDDFGKHTFAAQHIAHGVHHILRQMEVVHVRGVVAADILPVHIFRCNSEGAVDIKGLIGAAHNRHGRENQAEGQSHQRQRHDDYPTLLQGEEQVTHPHPYYTVLR